MKDGCPFCDTSIDQERFSRLQQNFPVPLPGAINVLFENQSYAVYPELHPAAKGVNTVLVVPKDHHLAYQAVPETEYSDFLEAIGQVQIRLGKGGRPITWFEHGTGTLSNRPESVSVGKSIYHAHLHATVNGSNLYPTLHKQVVKDFAGTNAEIREVTIDKPLPLVLAQAALGLPYLYLGGEGGHGIIVIEKEEVKVPSQYLRRVIARAENQEFINWKTMDELEAKEMALRLFDTMVLWSL